jgi:hypothetical protein
MAVVIQEFEVVPEAAPAAPAGAASPRPAAERPREADLARLLARRRERLARLRAH